MIYFLSNKKFPLLLKCLLGFIDWCYELRFLQAKKKKKNKLRNSFLEQCYKNVLLQPFHLEKSNSKEFDANTNSFDKSKLI